jgi:hypothetical protein
MKRVLGYAFLPAKITLGSIVSICAIALIAGTVATTVVLARYTR